MASESPGEGAQTSDFTASQNVAKLNALQEILEHVLSKKNLVRDHYLAGSMNPQMYIPIDHLLRHEQLQNMEVSKAEIAIAAARSAKIGVDEKEEMVRPLLKSKRNVVILRDVPEVVMEADIRQLLVGAPHEQQVAHIKPEVNNTWFIKFDLDDGCQDVVRWLQSKQLKGQPVHAAIKSEHFLRSFFPLQVPGGAASMQRPTYEFGAEDVNFYDMSSHPPEDSGYINTPSVLGLGGIPPPPPPEEHLPPPPGFPDGTGMAAAGWSPQPPGFWQPWGLRFQHPPLVLTGASASASSSKPLPGGGRQEASSKNGKGWKAGKAPKGGKDGKGKEKASWAPRVQMPSVEATGDNTAKSDACRYTREQFLAFAGEAAEVERPYNLKALPESEERLQDILKVIEESTHDV